MRSVINDKQYSNNNQKWYLTGTLWPCQQRTQQYVRFNRVVKFLFLMSCERRYPATRWENWRNGRRPIDNWSTVPRRVPECQPRRDSRLVEGEVVGRGAGGGECQQQVQTMGRQQRTQHSAQLWLITSLALPCVIDRKQPKHIGRVPACVSRLYSSFDLSHVQWESYRAMFHRWPDINSRKQAITLWT